MKKYGHIILFLVAIENVQSDELEIKKIAKELKKIVPGDVEADITPGPISNLFQVVVYRNFYLARPKWRSQISPPFPYYSTVIVTQFRCEF